MVNEADLEADGGPALRRRWWSAGDSVASQVIAIVLAGVAVQALLWFRGDSAAHVVAGAALTTFIGATIPKSWLRRIDAWAELVILGVVLSVSLVSEETVIGPFDPIDIAFTIAGASLALAALPYWATAVKSQRRWLQTAAVGLAIGALALRYLAGLGKG